METETQLVADPIALNEMKVAMALDDLIKLSKRKNTKGNRGRRSRRAKNKNRNFNGAARSNNPSKEKKHYVNSLSGVRQGAVAKRRSNFKGNQFPVATNVARKATNVPPLSVRRRAFNAGRMTSANQSRLLAPPVQSRSRFIAKRHEVEQKAQNGGEKWKTLDSRFAIMKEQRKSNNNNDNGVKVAHVPILPPWARARRF